MIFYSKTTTLFPSFNSILVLCLLNSLFLTAQISENKPSDIIKEESNLKVKATSDASLTILSTDKIKVNTSDSAFDEIKLISNERRIVYYTNGHNGMELISKKADSTIVVSTYDSRPILKEQVAELLYRKFVSKEIIVDSLLKFSLPSATVIGLFKVEIFNTFTNLEFYFKKIYWNNGLTEIHEGQQFVPAPSSNPFIEPILKKRKIQ